MKRKKQESTLLVVLEWICGFVLGLALITTIWACFVYRDRNGSFLPKLNNKESSQSSSVSGLVLPASTPIPNGSNLQLDPNAAPETPPPQQAEGEALKNVSIVGFKTLKFAANSTEVSVDFYNPAANAGEYLMTFELLVSNPDGSLESVYSSGLVEAGNHIRNITLSHPIMRGTYEDCILRIQPYFASDRSPASTSEIVFTLYAE